MSNDPVSKVASWIAPGGNNDPVLSLLAQYRALIAEARDLRDRAQALEAELPESVEREKLYEMASFDDIASMKAAIKGLREIQPIWEAACEEIGVNDLEQAAEGLEYQAGEVRLSIGATVARSWDGLLAQLALVREDLDDFLNASDIDTVVAGVKRLAGLG